MAKRILSLSVAVALMAAAVAGYGCKGRNETASSSPAPAEPARATGQVSDAAEAPSAEASSPSEATVHQVQSAEEFASRVLKADKPVLVDFFATWCPPCKVLAPIIEQLARDYAGRVDFVKVDGDKLGKLMSRYKIRAYPTVVIFDKGQPAQQFVGLRAASVYSTALDAITTN